MGPQLPWAQMLTQQTAEPPMEQPMYSSEYMQPNYSEYQQTSQTMPVDPQIMAQYRKLLSKQVEGLDMQKEGLGKLKEYQTREANRPLEPDYTALMMASDAWNGTDFQKQYKAPASDADKSLRMANADLAVQKAKGDLTDDEINLLKAQMSGLHMMKQGQKMSQAPITPFLKASETEQGKKYGEVQSGATKAEEQMTMIDDAQNELQKYVQNSKGGTGPFATGLGMKKYFDAPTQDLEAKFRMVNIKDMAATFQGMSKAVDSNAERRAWEATQPSLNNDEGVNSNILLGAKALALKAKTEAQYQKQWVEGQGRGSLMGYQSPILGKTAAVMTQNGEMKLIPREKLSEAKKQGFLSLDDYSAKKFGTKGAAAAEPNSDADAEREAIYQQFPHLRKK